jgi:hypothetical protein
MTDTKDAANNEMYSAFGRATTAWQHVEDGLCDLFNRIVICSIAGSMRSAPRAFFLTGNIFYSFTNLRSRLVMMDNLIEGTITDANLAGEWNAIKNKVLRIYKYRNTMAHSHVWGNEIQGLTTLRPSICKKCKKMNLQQILAAEQSFRKTAERITACAIAVNKHLVHPGGIPDPIRSLFPLSR